MPSSTCISGSSARPDVARLFLVLTLAGACRGEAVHRAPLEIDAVVDSLRPAVERAVGLRFRTPPRSAMVEKDEVRRYIRSRLDKEFPADRREGLTAAYRLLGLLPDSLDLEALLLDLYSEQVAGYYDPETGTLYGVVGGDRTHLRLVLAHELVHALQHQYLPLDSLMTGGHDGDRAAATQAVLEGHATLASVKLLALDTSLIASDAFWEEYRIQVRAQQRAMPVFASAPLVLREALIFPYITGAAFMRWWGAARPSPLPTVGELPASTEQVLHPLRYPGDAPVTLRFVDSSAAVQFEDTLGELEFQILLAQLAGGAEPALDAPIGWGGDRYRVYRTPEGPALVWYLVWDGSPQADRALDRLRAGQPKLARSALRLSIERVDVGGRPGVRVVHAPADWPRWAAVPAARAVP